MVIHLILYFSSNHFTAFLKKALLSVMILTRLSHLHIISLKSHCPIALELSCFNAQASIYKDNPHLPCTTYLQPFDAGLMYTVNACKT